jgi:hypothetical protein
MKDIDTVGGSIGCAWIGVSTVGSQKRVGDGALGEAGDGDDVAGLSQFDRLTLEAAEGEHLGDTAGLDRACRRATAPSPPGSASPIRRRCGR